MIPESRLIRSELIIRDLSLPEDVLLARKSLIRWLALSLGLILPNESRTLLLDILEALIEFQLKNRKPTTKEILERMQELTGEEQNPKAVYYHLQKLMESGLIKRKKGEYSFGEGEGLSQAFRGAYIANAEKAFLNIDRALVKLQKSY